ncbi:unnamed protein product [Rhodiola kirilowii]
MSVPVGLSFLQSSFSYSQSLLPPKPNLAAFPLRESRRPSLVVLEANTRTRQDTELLATLAFVQGTTDRPRLCVFRSNKHIHVQVIDDSKMHTLAAASTQQKAISEEIDYTSGPTIEVAKKIGEAIAKSCLEKGIVKVAFDRGGYPYHGRIEALADAAREHGLQF